MKLYAERYSYCRCFESIRFPSVPLAALAIGILLVTEAAFAQDERSLPRPQRAADVAEQTSDIGAALRNPNVRTMLANHTSGIDFGQLEIEADRLLGVSAETSREIYSQSPNILDPVRRLDEDQLRRLRSAPARSMTRRPAGEIAPSLSRAGRVDRNIAEQNLDIRRIRPLEPSGPYLNVHGFGQDIHAALEHSVHGYMMQLRKDGNNIYTLQWGWARDPGEGALGWHPNRRMHIASVSKFMTAVALTLLLDSKGIDYNSPISPYLPRYWHQGPNIEKITFASLMTHQSGFHNLQGQSTFQHMQQFVAAGVPTSVPTSHSCYEQAAAPPMSRSCYENVNYTLTRVLIGTIGGYIDPEFDVGGFNELVWNLITILAYEDYVTRHVLALSGVHGAGLTKSPQYALAYRRDGTGTGWDSGNLAHVSGTAAWHMSVDDLLKVAHAVRRVDFVLSSERAQWMLDQRFGIDGRWATAMGNIYHKNGLWWDGECAANPRAEQAVLLMLPDNMELAILVNSPIGSDCASLRGLLRTAFEDNIVAP